MTSSNQSTYIPKQSVNQCYLILISIKSSKKVMKTYSSKYAYAMLPPHLKLCLSLQTFNKRNKPKLNAKHFLLTLILKSAENSIYCLLYVITTLQNLSRIMKNCFLLKLHNINLKPHTKTIEWKSVNILCNYIYKV
jgi:hypothetical protein